MDVKALWKEAVEARKFSYSPYSKFKVGAALLCEDGTVIRGCNVENSAYGPTNCAERTAFFTAIANGQRDFKAIAVVGGEDDLVDCYPCGVCRQVMSEFCYPDTFQIICGKTEEEIEVFSLKDLLPKGFTKK